MTEKHHANRRALQLERIILFSDAVFAIAITLLVIEIKVPSLHGGEATEQVLLHELFLLIPKLVGFLVSFFLVGLYWTRHHLLFGYLSDYSAKLIWLNLIFLLSIVLMPFSTGIFGEYSTPQTLHLKAPLIIYVLNVCFTGVMLYLLWDYVGKPGNEIADSSLNPAVAKAAKLRAVLITIVFASVIPASFVNALAARYVPLLLPVVLRFARPRQRGRK
jgi:uncharacterized membrane protein